MPKTRCSQKGFTLLELLLVVTILAILFGVLINVLDIDEYLGQSRDSQRVTDFNKLNTAMTNALTDNAIQLTSTTGCTDCDSINGTEATDGTGWIQFNNLNGRGLSDFLFKLPLDPTNKDSFAYSYHSDGTNFEINTVFESDLYNAEHAAGDGGNNDNVYEIGWDLTIEN